MLFAYIEYLRSQSVGARKRLVWWYSSACTLAVVLVWLGVVLLGGGQQYTFGNASDSEVAEEQGIQKASAQERLNALRAEVGYPPLPAIATTTDAPIQAQGNATPAPIDPEAYAQWQNSYFSEEPAPVATTSAPFATPTTNVAPNPYE